MMEPSDVRDAVSETRGAGSAHLWTENASFFSRRSQARAGSKAEKVRRAGTRAEKVQRAGTKAEKVRRAVTRAEKVQRAGTRAEKVRRAGTRAEKVQRAKRRVLFSTDEEDALLDVV